MVVDGWILVDHTGDMADDAPKFRYTIAQRAVPGCFVQRDLGAVSEDEAVAAAIEAAKEPGLPTDGRWTASLTTPNGTLYFDRHGQRGDKPVPNDDAPRMTVDRREVRVEVD